MDLVTILIMLGLFALVVFPGVFFGLRCSHCHRWFALTRTGKTKGGESFYDTPQEQWRCRYCQQTGWKLGGASNKKTKKTET